MLLVVKRLLSWLLMSRWRIFGLPFVSWFGKFSKRPNGDVGSILFGVGPELFESSLDRRRRVGDFAGLLEHLGNGGVRVA